MFNKLDQRRCCCVDNPFTIKINLRVTTSSYIHSRASQEKNLISELDRKVIETNFQTHKIQPEENTGIEAEHHAEASHNEEMQDGTNTPDNSQILDVTGVTENVNIEGESDQIESRSN